MKLSACFSSKSDLWKTPKKLYDYFINKGYFDPCPCNPVFDGLAISWRINNFVNPPYSNISSWVDKALFEVSFNKSVIMLLPARTDTNWFYKLYTNGASFIFINGRLKFNDCVNSAPFPSMFVVLNNSFALSLPYVIDRNNRFWER